MKIHLLYTDSNIWLKGAKHRVHNGIQRCCLLGAIDICYPSNGRLIRNRIRDRLRIESISDWNDAEDRTFEHIKNLVTELDI